MRNVHNITNHKGNPSENIILLKWLLFKRKQTLVAFLKGFILLIEVYISTIGRNIANMENIFQISQKNEK